MGNLDQETVDNVDEEINIPEQVEEDIEADDADDEAADQEVGDGEESEDNDGAEEPEEEFEEIEFEGKKYSVPKELKPAILRQSDYSRKMNETAELQKTYDIKVKEFEEIAKVREQEFMELSEVHAISRQIEEYSKLDWNALAEENPIEFMKLDRNLKTLQEARTQKLYTIQQRVNQRSQKEQQETAALKEAARKELSTKIKNWNEQTESSLKGYAKELGFKEEHINRAFDLFPAEVEILNKAYQFDQLHKKATAKQPKPEVKPVKSVRPGGGKTTMNTAPSDKDSTEAWMKKREAQLRKQDRR